MFAKGELETSLSLPSVMRFSELLLLIRHNKRFAYYKKKGIFFKNHEEKKNLPEKICLSEVKTLIL